MDVQYQEQVVTTADRTELERILAKQSPDDAIVLSRLLERPWQAARRRITLRNEALEAAAALLPDAPLTVRAKDLARRLARQAVLRHREILDNPLVQAMNLVLKLDGGYPVAWRTIYGALQNSTLAVAIEPTDVGAHACSQTDPAPRGAFAYVGDATH